MEKVKLTKARLPKGSHKGRQMAHNFQTNRYGKQRFRTTRNKARAWKKHLENHPNDLQAKVAITKAIAKADKALLR